MRDLYSDDYASVAGDGADRLIPEGVRRLAGAAVFLGLVGGDGPLVLPARHPRRGRGADHPGDGGAGPRRARRIRAGCRRRTRGSRSTPCSPGSRRRCRATAPPARAGAGGADRGGRAAGRAGARRAGGAGRAGARARPADLPMPPDEDAEALATAPSPERAPAADAGAAPRRGGAPAPADAAAARRPPAPRPRTGRATWRSRAPRPRRSPRAPSRGGGGGRGAGGARGLERRGRAARLVQLGAFDSEEITRQAWSQLVAAQRRPARRRRASTSSAPPRTRGCSTGCGSRASPDTEQTRVMCEALRGARHRLHPGDAAVDGARAPSSSAAPGRRSAPAERRVLRARPSPGASSSSPATSRARRSCARLTGGAARQRRARRAGADRPGGRPGGAAARRRDWREWAPALEECARLPGPRRCGRGRCTCATG